MVIMKKHTVISVALIVVSILIPFVTHAAIFSKPTISFGGRVLSTSNSVITCTGLGVGPVILSSNLGSLGSALSSATDTTDTSLNRMTGAAEGLYGAIPYFAKITFSARVGGVIFVSTPPKAGDWILGRASLIPNFTTCYIPYLSIPFPIKDTSQYKVSENNPLHL
jgi:hypothetical protein